MRKKYTAFLMVLASITPLVFSEVHVDFSKHDPLSAIQIEQTDQSLKVSWPITAPNKATATLSLTTPDALIESLALTTGQKTVPLLENATPAFNLFIGERDLKKRDGWTVFFDKVDAKGYINGPLELNLNKIAVESGKTRATIKYSSLHFADFSGELWFTFFEGSPLIHVEAVVSTEKDARAILYTGALSMNTAQVQSVTYHQAGAEIQSIFNKDVAAFRQWEPFKSRGLGKGGDTSQLYGQFEKGYLQTKNRAVAARLQKGSVAVFPTPHKFLYPLDYAENFAFNFAWKKGDRLEIGARQPPVGDGRHRPWVNAPPTTRQHLDLFLLVSQQDAEDVLRQAKTFTNDDRFQPLPGYKTFTSHYHFRHTRSLMIEQEKQGSDEIPKTFQNPEFRKKLKEAGVDIAHLAEFHGGPKTGKTRLEELQLLHSECDRLSDDEILIIPGEEPNVHLGGHWMSFFPKPVYWDFKNPKLKSKQNGPTPPFKREDPKLGTIYYVNSPEDVLKLMELENGLMWTAHPRIKGSAGYPDAYKDEPFFKSEHYLGGAWKAMPSDYSREKLGERVLDLLDDMNNWGDEKQMIGEADLFELNLKSELYGHLNINYLKLEKLPRFKDGWMPIRDALKQRKYFTTTGEILIPSLKINGQEFVERLETGETPEVSFEADLRWTFPLSYAEIISGDGNKVYRERIDLSDTAAFGSRVLRKTVNLKDRTWVRFEVWDVAENGAFTPPVLLR